MGILYACRMQSMERGCEIAIKVETINIPLEIIKFRRLEIRSSQGDMDGLKQSILQHGLLNPILVRRSGSNHFEVVVGNRRLKAFQDLGIQRIPAKVIEADDRECYVLLLVENIQRETLDPLDEARAFYDYVCSEEKNGFGYGSVSELARRIGKSQEYVSNRMRILRLPESTLRQLLEGTKLKVSHIEELASIAENPEAVKELANLVSMHQISVRVLEKAVQLIKSGLDSPRALELAKIESEMGLTSSNQLEGAEHISVLVERTKRVLEATLSYLDGISPEFEKETIYKYWLKNVRLPVHDAIDAVILCQRMTRAKASAHQKVTKTGRRL